jgi:RNA polymerase sigma-70 factor (ECF subfamily)
MAPPGRSSDSAPRGTRSFATTRWSLVLSAGEDSRPESRKALSDLCEAYWYPLYYYVRRRGHGAEDARDLTQEFFATLLEKESLRVADPARGRFRSFLLGSLSHFLANEWRRRSAQKRGGRRGPLPFDLGSAEDRYAREPAHDLTPEKAFERRWAILLLDGTLSRLRNEYAAAGKVALFEKLSPYLAGRKGAAYGEVARALDLSEGAVKVAVHRLRRRCRDLLRAEVAQTVDDPAEVDEELRHLMSAVGD